MNRLIANKAGNLIGLFNMLDESTPEGYNLAKGDVLIEDATGLSMLKPHWDGEKWVEQATAEEIMAAKAAVAMPPMPANVQDLAIAELVEMVLTNQLQTDLAIAEIYETLI